MDAFNIPLSNDCPPRVALLVEYCGQFFHGSQFQPGVATVQSAIQEALAGLQIAASPVSFAGRTDAGVSALGQVAHFDWLENFSSSRLRTLPSALNALLPETVSVRACALADRRFNSRRDAHCKWYRYQIYNGAVRSALAMQQGSTWHRFPLDATLMNQAAQSLIGMHDFRSFQDSASAIAQTQCQVYYSSVTRHGDFITFDIVANRFLYKMVRSVAGQLMMIGNASNPLPPQTLLSVLAKQDRQAAAFTASPAGLTLMALLYPDPFQFFEADAQVRHLQTILETMEFPHNENLFRKAS